jgi:hypothetical protein
MCTSELAAPELEMSPRGEVLPFGRRTFASAPALSGPSEIRTRKTGQGRPRSLPTRLPRRRAARLRPHDTHAEGGLLNDPGGASSLNRKGALCGAFAKPSGGLEPPTPSLPSNPGPCRGLLIVAKWLVEPFQPAYDQESTAPPGSGSPCPAIRLVPAGRVRTAAGEAKSADVWATSGPRNLAFIENARKGSAYSAGPVPKDQHLLFLALVDRPGDPERMAGRALHRPRWRARSCAVRNTVVDSLSPVDA